MLHKQISELRKFEQGQISKLISKLKKFEQGQISRLKRFEQEQVGKIDRKIVEVRMLIKAIEEGKLIDFARLSPDEYSKTVERQIRKGG